MRKISSMLILLMIVGLATSAFAIEMVGTWGVQIRKSALDGKETLLIVTASDNGNIGIRCDGAFTDVFFSLDRNPYMGRDAQSMPFSVDGGRVQRISVMPTDDGERLVLSAKKNIADAVFIHDWLIDRERFVFQLSPHNRGPHEVVLDIRGLREAISPYRHLCPEFVFPPKP